MVKAGVNFVETRRVERFAETGEELDSSRTSWSGNIESEDGKEGNINGFRSLMFKRKTRLFEDNIP